MKEKARSWLVEEGMFLEEIQGAEANFRFLFQFPPDHYMELVQPAGKPDLLLVLSPTTVSPEHRAIMVKANPEHRAEFIWALRFVMNTFAVDFEMVHPENVLERFTISDLIFEDGLTKDRLMAAIRRVWKANLQVIWIIQKEFGTMEKEEREPGSESVMFM